MYFEEPNVNDKWIVVRMWNFVIVYCVDVNCMRLEGLRWNFMFFRTMKSRVIFGFSVCTLLKI